jgi:RNA polymerase sigma-70 factor, ECF subfamily
MPETDLSDAEVVAQVLAGEVERFSDLVQRHHAHLSGILAFYCRSLEETEEVVQEAFVHCYRALSSYDHGQPFFPWLKTIALNVLRMELRRRQRVGAHVGPYMEHLRLSQLDEPRTLDDADARFMALRACLGLMQPQQVSLLKAKYEQERGIAELARQRGTSEGALKVALLRLRQVLRACIESRLTVRA